MLVIFGSISGAMALMLIARSAAGREFVALAAGLAALVGMVGSVALSPAATRAVAASAFAEGEAEAVAQAAQLLALGAPFLGVLVLGLPFVLAAWTRAPQSGAAAPSPAPAPQQPAPQPQPRPEAIHQQPAELALTARRMAEIEAEERYRAEIRARLAAEAEVYGARPAPRLAPPPEAVEPRPAARPEPPLRGGDGRRFPRVWGT